MTLHRPALVDGPLLLDAMAALGDVARRAAGRLPDPPAHARRAARARAGPRTHPGLHLLDPIGYVEFLGLISESAGVVTDSGGIQEETTFLGIPCFTLRDNTERPITIDMGTNRLLGLAPERIREVPELLAVPSRNGTRIPPGWDGKAAERLTDVIESFLAG